MESREQGPLTGKIYRDKNGDLLQVSFTWRGNGDGQYFYMVKVTSSTQTINATMSEQELKECDEVTPQQLFRSIQITCRVDQTSSAEAITQSLADVIATILFRAFGVGRRDVWDSAVTLAEGILQQFVEANPEVVVFNEEGQLVRRQQHREYVLNETAPRIENLAETMKMEITRLLDNGAIDPTKDCAIIFGAALENIAKTWVRAYRDTTDYKQIKEI